MDGDPYVNSELVGEMAEDADQLTSEVRQEREAGEVQDAFGRWCEETFGVDALADHLEAADSDDQQGLIDALVDRFETETGFDPSSIDTEAEPEYQPATFADDDADEYGDGDED